MAWIKLQATMMMERLLIWYWKRKAPVATPHWGWKTSLADNVQQQMNLIMPLADTTAIGRAKAVQMVAANIDELFTGLNNIGTVHSARFDLIGEYLCIITVYDGDHEVYIRDFISVFGSVFDAMIKVVADPPPWPTERHSAEFVKWVTDHEGFQVPYDLTAMFPDEKNLENLSRDLILLLDDNPYVQIGRFSGYPALSTAQIRLAAGVEW
jgi:hypothetical protein